MKRKPGILKVALVIACACLLYGGWAAVRAHGNRVSLNVRDMDVRDVVRKVERQTWETILVDKEVQGKVTLHVNKMPLDEVLRIIAQQTYSRSSAIYPLYSNGKSLTALKKSLRGELDPATHGWTNLQSRGPFGGGPMFGMRGPGGPFGGPDASPTQFVTLQIHYKDIGFVSQALNRFAQVRLVPEDGITRPVSLSWNHTPIDDAVALVAKKTDRSWTKLYSLRREFGRGGPMQFAARDPNGERLRRGPRQELTDAEREALRKEREAREAELREALSPEERAKLEELQNLTPEQRRERFEQMSGRNMSKMMLDRIKNSTPEQRAEERRLRRQMRPPGERGGPGQPGPGQGGPPTR